MENSFHKSISSANLERAISILLKEKIDEETFVILILMKMRLSLIKKAINEGRIKDVEDELQIKNKIAFQLLNLYEDIRRK